MKKKLNLYEVHIPVQEIWVFEVVAENKKQAWERRSNPYYSNQVCSLSGTQKKIKLLKRKVNENGD